MHLMGVPAMLICVRLLLVLSLALAVQTACGHGQRFPLRLYDLGERELLEKADTIVVGKTVGIEWDSARQPIRWSRQYGVSSVRLVRVRLSVEHVIRGAVDGPEVIVHYWAAEAFTNGVSLNLPSKEARAVHYLVTEDGRLRYVVDLVRSTTRLFSGYHRKAPEAAGRSAEARISSMLLTPGEGVNVEEFVTNLPTAAGTSALLAGYVQTLRYLEALAGSPNWDVRWGACLQLHRGSFKGQDRCVDQMAPEAVAHGHERELREIQSLRSAAEPRFQRAFLSDPIRTAKAYAVLPGERGVADFLGMLERHPNQQIATRAREELRKCCRGGPVL